MNNFQDPRQRCASGGYSLDKQQPTMKTPTKEQILEAAKTSPEAKDALKKLFPEVFEEDKYFDLTELNGGSQSFGTRIGNLMCIRTCGEYANKAFFLADFYKWEIKIDNLGYECLIPTKKH